VDPGNGIAFMAKKQRGRPKVSDRDDVTIKIDRPLASMIKAIANRRGVGSAEVLSDLARTPVEKAYRQMLRELEDDHK
jgi:hypothetical protein